MKKSLILGLQIIITLIASVLLGTVLLIIVYMLPTDEMKNNVRRSTAVYDSEGVYPQLMAGYKMSQLDNSTDATMLLGAIYPGSGNYIEDAMKVHRIEYFERDPVGCLTDYANDVKKETYTIAYPRYWHGYLVILKPLLLFFDVADIRMFNMCLFFGAVLYILEQMRKQKLERYILWFVVTLVALNPLAIPLSFQFSTVTYIALFSSIIALKCEHWDFKKQMFFFMIIGIVTAYFDFLTFPLVGLYIPMIFILVRKKDWKQATQTVIFGSIMWIIGYSGMWAGKWLIGSLLTGGNVIQDAVARAGHWAGEEEISRLQIIMKNIFVLVKWPIVILGGIVLIKLAKVLSEGRKAGTVNWTWGIPFGIIMVAPFVWYLAMGGHSYVHYWFTYRELCVTIMACLMGVQSIAGSDIFEC